MRISSNVCGSGRMRASELLIRSARAVHMYTSSPMNPFALIETPLDRSQLHYWRMHTRVRVRVYTQTRLYNIESRPRHPKCCSCLSTPSFIHLIYLCAYGTRPFLDCTYIHESRRCASCPSKQSENAFGVHNARVFYRGNVKCSLNIVDCSFVVGILCVGNIRGYTIMYIFWVCGQSVMTLKILLWR